MNAPLNHPLPDKFRPACHQVYAAIKQLGACVQADVVQLTDLKPTTVRNAVVTLREAEWITRTREDRQELLRINPSPPATRIKDTPLLELAKQRGWIRSNEAAQKLGISKAQVEQQMHDLQASGDAITCTIQRPGEPDQVELRPFAFIQDAGPFRIID